MMLFMFLYVGSEYAFGFQLTTFSVLSDLHLTKKQGAQVQSLFWGVFSITRFIAIFVAWKFKPITFATVSFSICIFGTLWLCFMAEYTLTTLQIGIVIYGIGESPIYASGKLVTLCINIYIKLKFN